MLLKYREAILYIFLLILIFVTAVKKTFPDIVNIITIERSIGDQSVQLADAERKLDALKAAELEKLNLTGQTKKIYKPDLTGLDAESSFTVIFDDIIDMAKYNGIRIYAIEYTYNPPEDEFVKGAPTKYNVCQVNMQIIADYPDLESFLKELYKYPYLVNLDKIEVTPYPKNKKILLTILQMRLYSSKV